MHGVVPKLNIAHIILRFMLKTVYPCFMLHTSIISEMDNIFYVMFGRIQYLTKISGVIITPAIMAEMVYIIS